MKLERASFPLEIDVVQQRQIEFILLDGPGIYDYTIPVRRTSNSADEIIICFIRLRPVD